MGKALTDCKGSSRAHVRAGEGEEKGLMEGKF